MNVVRGGTVVTEAGVFRADVVVSGGRVAAIGRNLVGDTLYDATGLHVFAGFVDRTCTVATRACPTGRTSRR